MKRALLVLVSLIPVAAVAQEAPKFPIQTARWALLGAAEEDTLTAEVVVGSRPEIVRREVKIRIPYQTTGPNGSKGTGYKTQTRMHDVKIEQAITESVTLKPTDLVFLNPAGKRYKFEEDIKERLRKPIPVLLLTKVERNPFYEALLKPDTILVVVPPQSLPKQDWKPESDRTED